MDFIQITPPHGCVAVAGVVLRTVLVENILGRDERTQRTSRGRPMKITVLGRGSVGGGLSALWQRAGHAVTALGSDGGDASDADVVVVAVPSNAIADALGKVSGIAGKTTVDATNAYAGRPEEFKSLAHQIKSIVGGPTAKAFNLNFAALYDEVERQRVTPSNLYAADDAAREATEQLIRDAGYEPVSAGNLEAARLLENHLELMFAINQADRGPFFYRIAEPGGL
jgi:8-hydroxy-5-deazaflavin:NADPH oxidoreductase